MYKNSSGYEDPRINGPVSRTRTTAQARTRQAPRDARDSHDNPGAARDLERALGIRRDVGNRYGEVTTLNEAGALSMARGDLGLAGTLWPPAKPPRQGR